MPASRRTIGRVPTIPPSLDKLQKFQKSGETSPSSLSPSSLNGVDDGGYYTETLVKHAQVPNLPTESNFLFEVLIFVFSVLALGLQYIHVYKTVWWLPYSHSNYALNFYLIDPYLVAFIVILLSRRVAFAFFKWFQFSRTRHRCLYWFSTLCRFGVSICFVGALFWTGFHVIRQQGIMYIPVLAYPLVTYLVLFGFKIKPFFGKVVMIHKSAAEKAFAPNKPKEAKPDSLTHTCATTPDAIRQEVESLKNDFNKRLKQVLFNSFFCTYYSGFVPLCFTQNTMYYNVVWVWQHIALVWFTVFLLYFLHFLSSKYIDVLHCCSLHLGKWSKVEGRHIQGPLAWSELQIWRQASLVKHIRGHFKAECIINAAEPGNNMHIRFHFLFYHPLRVCHGLLGLSSTLVIYQLVNLILASEWSQIISLSFLLFTAYYILFKIIRDTLALRKAYRNDESLS